MTKPRDRAVPALSPRRMRGRARGRGGDASQWRRPPSARSPPSRPCRDRRTSFCTFVQPPSPSWSIVNCPGRTGNFFRLRLEHALHDRPVAPVGEDLLRRRRLQEADERRSPCPCWRSSSSTAIGFSIRIVERGITYCTFWPASWAPIASFSYVSRTSPLPERNVFSESRALLSWTATCWKSCSSFALRLRLRLAELAPGAVGGHHVPAGAAGGERVRRDHLHARLEQVVPAT